MELEILLGKNTHFFKCSLHKIASMIIYPGGLAPTNCLTKSNLPFQSSLRSSPRSFNTATHRLFVFSISPLGPVNSFPMLPRMSSLFLIVDHSHFMPLSVSPSPSVMTNRGTT